MIFLLLIVQTSSFDTTGGSMMGYYTMEEVTAHMESLVEAHPELEYSSIGSSYEGEPIPAIRLVNEGAPKALIVGAHHARELISVTQVLYVLDKFLTEPDDEALSLKASLEILFVPVLNVDTYKLIGDQYAKTHQILGVRKNRRPGDCSIAELGVDLNRNYGFEWGYDNIGSNPHECAEDYRGEEAFSEPETQAMREVLKEQFTVAVSYHSWGNLYIHPYSYPLKFEQSLLRPGDYASYLRLKKHICKECEMGTALELVNYGVNGNFIDYAYSIGTFSLAVEMGHSFHPEKSKIQHTLDLHLESLMYLLSLATCKIESQFHEQFTPDGYQLNINATNVGMSTGSLDIILVIDREFEVGKIQTSQTIQQCKNKRSLNIKREMLKYEELELFINLSPKNVEVEVKVNQGPIVCENESNLMSVNSEKSYQWTTETSFAVFVFLAAFLAMILVYMCYKCVSKKKYNSLHGNNSSSIEVYYT